MNSKEDGGVYKLGGCEILPTGDVFFTRSWYRGEACFSSSSSQYSFPETVKLWENVELLAERGWSGVGGLVGGRRTFTSNFNGRAGAQSNYYLNYARTSTLQRQQYISYTWSCQQNLDFYKCILYIESTIIVQCIAREIGLSSPLLEG